MTLNVTRKIRSRKTRRISEGDCRLTCSERAGRRVRLGRFIGSEKDSVEYVKISSETRIYTELVWSLKRRLNIALYVTYTVKNTVKHIFFFSYNSCVWYLSKIIWFQREKDYLFQQKIVYALHASFWTKKSNKKFLQKLCPLIRRDCEYIIQYQV